MAFLLLDQYIFFRSVVLSDESSSPLKYLLILKFRCCVRKMRVISAQGGFLFFFFLRRQLNILCLLILWPSSIRRDFSYCRGYQDLECIVQTVLADLRAGPPTFVAQTAKGFLFFVRLLFPPSRIDGMLLSSVFFGFFLMTVFIQFIGLVEESVFLTPLPL